MVKKCTPADKILATPMHHPVLKITISRSLKIDHTPFEALTSWLEIKCHIIISLLLSFILHNQNNKPF